MESHRISQSIISAMNSYTRTQKFEAKPHFQLANYIAKEAQQLIKGALIDDAIASLNLFILTTGLFNYADDVSKDEDFCNSVNKLRVQLTEQNSHLFNSGQVRTYITQINATADYLEMIQKNKLLSPENSLDKAFKAQNKKPWRVQPALILTKEPIKSQFKEPEPEQPHLWTKTLNNTGYAQPANHFTHELIKKIEDKKSRILEIGCAFGKDSKAFLKAAEGNKGKLVAMDIDPGHINITQNKIWEHSDRVTLQVGDITHTKFPDNYFDAIYISNVLHFLLGENIENVARELFACLKPGGALFVISPTPYMNALKPFSGASPTATESPYAKLKKAGEKWPCWQVNFRHFAPPERANDVPEHQNFLDLDTLTNNVFKPAGFVDIQATYINRLDLAQSFPAASGDGHESVGGIGIKPLLK